MLAECARATLKSSGLGFRAGRSFFLRWALVSSTSFCSSFVMSSFAGSPARDEMHTPRHNSIIEDRIMTCLPLPPGRSNGRPHAVWTCHPQAPLLRAGRSARRVAGRGALGPSLSANLDPGCAPVRSTLRYHQSPSQRLVGMANSFVWTGLSKRVSIIEPTGSIITQKVMDSLRPVNHFVLAVSRTLYASEARHAAASD